MGGRVAEEEEEEEFRGWVFFDGELPEDLHLAWTFLDHITGCSPHIVGLTSFDLISPGMYDGLLRRNRKGRGGGGTKCRFVGDGTVCVTP